MIIHKYIRPEGVEVESVYPEPYNTREDKLGRYDADISLEGSQ
jgi:hypothetical protein